MIFLTAKNFYTAPNSQSGGTILVGSPGLIFNIGLFAATVKIRRPFHPSGKQGRVMTGQQRTHLSWEPYSLLKLTNVTFTFDFTSAKRQVIYYSYFLYSLGATNCCTRQKGHRQVSWNVSAPPSESCL